MADTVALEEDTTSPRAERITDLEALLSGPSRDRPPYASVWAERQRLRTSIDQTIDGGALPQTIVEDLVSGGILRLLLPREFGGRELDPVLVLRILEDLAWTSGSLGWMAMVACQSPILLGLLPRSTFEALYRDGPNVYLASSSMPSGRAEEVPGGWRVSGNWLLVTGTLSCQWFLAHSLTASGLVLATLHSRSDCDFPRDPTLSGLQTSATTRATLEACYAPSSHAFVVGKAASCASTLAMRLPPAEHFSLQMAAIASGILHHVIEIGQARNLKDPSPKRKFEDIAFAGALGGAAALAAILRPALERTMQDLASGLERASSALAPTPALPVARYLVDLCISSLDAISRLSGSEIVWEQSALLECIRDMRCLAQHSNLSPGRLTQLGARLLTMDSRWT